MSKENTASMFSLKSKIFLKTEAIYSPKHKRMNGFNDVKTQKIGTFYIQRCKCFSSNRIKSLVYKFRVPCATSAQLSSLVIQTGRERGSWVRHNNYIVHMQQTIDERVDETYRGAVPTGRRVTCTWVCSIVVFFLSSWHRQYFICSTDFSGINVLWFILQNLFRCYFVSSILHVIQTGSGAHSTSYPMGRGVYFPEAKAVGEWSWPLPSN
jgi:hypothetical protein